MVPSKIARQLELHPRIVDRDVRRQDERVPVALLPQAVNHRCHKAQYATGTLEFHQRRPIGVEPIEDLRMDWVGCLQPFFVVGIAALGRELLVLRSVKVREGARYYVPVLELRRSAIGSNRRRRTISKPSSALAGRHEDSTRPTTGTRSVDAEFGYCAKSP